MEIWRDRTVRAEQFDDVPRVINRRIEIGVVADLHGQAIFDIGLGNQTLFEYVDPEPDTPTCVPHLEQGEKRVP